MRVAIGAREAEPLREVLAHLVPVEDLDRSVRGEGNMLVRVASTFTLADSRGPEMDEGALMRLLASIDENLWVRQMVVSANGQ